MRKLFLLLLALWVADEALGHGGTFRGPNGGVPPGLRDPSDPEPPPPPPSDPGPPTGPITPDRPDTGPVTPPDRPGSPTGQGGTPIPGPAPLGGRNRRNSRTVRLTFESWRFWWAYNSADILNLKSHVYARGVSSSSSLWFAAGLDRSNRRNAELPTRHAIQKVILPALKATIDRPRDHEDVHGGAIVATGKLGGARHIAMLGDILRNRYRSPRGKRLHFGGQATESAVLALGLLRELDEPAREAVRRICLEAIADEKLRARERAWAAVALGLQRDTGSVDALWDLLGRKYADDNIPAGILTGIGLSGDLSKLGGLESALTKGRLNGVPISDRVRSFVGYAIAKIGRCEALGTVNAVLRSRRHGRMVKRSAAIAAGVLGARASDDLKDETVQVLRRFLKGRGSDPSSLNFGIIALSQIGTRKALLALLDIAENGRFGQRPFAALGLATHVFYRERATAEHKGEPMDADLKRKIVDKLARLSARFEDSDTRAAMLLCRGLVKDESAVPELVRIASRKGNPVPRGYACVALGLIGNAGENVKDALTIALRERSDADLRRNAATGLGLLRDARVVDLLLRKLEQARSFAVQGQLITAIGTIGDHRAIEPLVRILDDMSQPTRTRAMAAVGLGMIGDLEPVPALSRLAKNYNYRASVPELDELLYIF